MIFNEGSLLERYSLDYKDRSGTKIEGGETVLREFRKSLAIYFASFVQAFQLKSNSFFFVSNANTQLLLNYYNELYL